MAEIIEARDLRGKRTERLIDAVPLDRPWSLFLEPTNACNFRCAYCPTGQPDLLKQVGRKPTLMRYELWTKIVDELRAFPRKLKIVNTYKDGESLIHPRYCEMIRYLCDADVTERIWLKTNGYLLNPDYNARLVACGLDMIGISVQHVHAQGFYDVAGVRINYDQYRANILDLYQRRGDVKVSVKIADVGLSDADKRKFFDDFGDRCDYITIEGLHGWSTSELHDWKLGTDNSFDGSPRTDKIACPLVLYMLTVSANGDVSICNDDFAHYHKIGNANEESMTDIWRGTRLRDFRMMHLTGNRKDNRACAHCDYLRALPD